MNIAMLPNDINERAVVYVREIKKLESQRDELVAALKLVRELARNQGGRDAFSSAIFKASDAALAKVKP
jgi:Asp/Glu/hydantoin racemase